MKPPLKFNLVFLIVFAIGFGVAANVARELLQRDTHAEVLDRARLLMEKAVVVSAFTAEHIAPLLETQMKYSFLPESVPLFVSTDVSVPLAVPLQRADHALGVVMALLAAVFLLIGGTLNLMLWKLVIQPVSRLSALSDRVSMGDMEAPEFAAKSRDEIGVLAESFARMRKSLVHAMKLLDS